MAGERRERILGRLIEGTPPGVHTKKLCEVCAEVTEMSGAGIMLMIGEHPLGSVCTTDKISALIEELQFALGEGPCVDAHKTDRPVLEPDLVDPETLRWPAFSVPAIEAGARAVFGFPLQVGAVRLGALNLYRNRPGSLTDEQHANALVMADIAAQSVLLLQAEAPPGKLANELSTNADFNYIVHQAAGMIAAQMNITVGESLVTLRAFAFGNDRQLREVAKDVVGGTLRFGPKSSGSGPHAR